MQKQDARPPVQPDRSGQASTRNKVQNDNRNMGTHRPVATPAGEVDRLFGMWNSL